MFHKNAFQIPIFRKIRRWKTHGKTTMFHKNAFHFSNFQKCKLEGSNPRPNPELQKQKQIKKQYKQNYQTNPGPRPGPGNQVARQHQGQSAKRPGHQVTSRPSREVITTRARVPHSLAPGLGLRCTLFVGVKFNS